MEKEYVLISDALDFCKKDCERIKTRLNSEVASTVGFDSPRVFLTEKFSIYGITFDCLKSRYLNNFYRLKRDIDALRVIAKASGYNLICEDVELIVEDNEGMAFKSIFVQWKVILKYEKI